MKTSEICKECSQQSDCCFIDNGLQHRCGVVSAYKRGFEDGIGHGWHPASELPPENTEIIIWTEVHSPQFENAPVGYVPILGRLIDGKWPSNIIVKYWCYLPEKE